MLETARSDAFLTGTNVKGQVAGANWMFLRPRLPAEHIVCIGTPSAATLETLRAFGERVTIASRNAPELRAASVDLIVVAGRLHRWRLQHDRRLRKTLASSLKAEGLWYYEFHGALSRAFSGDRLRRALDPDAVAVEYWMTPLAGEVHTAVTVTDRSLAGYFRKDLLSRAAVKTAGGFKDLVSLASRLRRIDDTERIAGASTRATRSWRRSIAPVAGAARRWIAAAGRVADRQPLIARLFGRCGVLVGHAPFLGTPGPPAYLRAIAERSGISLAGCRWGLSAPGDYSSRKLLFFLADADDGGTAARPTAIVKMVRKPALNRRLENEHEALCALRDLGIAGRDAVPRPLFCGRHAGLAIVGETAIEGRPFRRRTTHSAACPYLHAAIDLLLAIASKSSAGTTADERSRALEPLRRQFEEIYELTPSQRAFMYSQTAALSDSDAALPSVFQHGDPGTWNWLVTSAGGVALLDWEASERRGVPLWDLFYFLRTYCVDAARAGGLRNALSGFEQEFLGATPLGDLVCEAVHEYSRAVGVPTPLIGPCLYTCWMHRALKEATRLTPARLQSGHYVSLLRLCIDRRAFPGMKRLCGLEAASPTTTSGPRARRRNATTRSSDSSVTMPPAPVSPVGFPNPRGAAGE